VDVLAVETLSVNFIVEREPTHRDINSLGLRRDLNGFILLDEVQAVVG